MSFETFQDPIAYRMRRGSVEDPYVPISQTDKVRNGTILLREIPDKFNGITITDGNINLATKDSGLPDENTVVVDWTNGILTFDSSYEGQTFTVDFMGRGNVYLPASKVYTNVDENDNVTETLQTLIDDTEYARDSANEAADNLVHLGEYDNATQYKKRNIVTYQGSSYMAIQDTLGNLPTDQNYWKPITYFNWKGTYSSSATYGFGDFVSDENNYNVYLSIKDNNIGNPLNDTTYWTPIINAQTVIDNMIQATDDANTATTNANDAATNANTAATNANNAASNANTKAGYAQTQGDYAKSKGDYANQVGIDVTNNVNIIWKSPVNTYADLSTTYPSPQIGWTAQVSADPDSAKNGVYRYNGSSWTKIHNFNVSGYANVANLNIVDLARAELVRQQVPSGVLGIDTYVLNNGLIWAKDGVGVSTTTLNALYIGAFNAVINGYVLNAKGSTLFSSSGSDSMKNTTLVNLPAPPTFGTRDDLVFLEAWFPQGGNGYELNWRIRTVAGVDFSKYPEGLGFYGAPVGTDGWDVTAQGGNSSPLSKTDWVTGNGNLTCFYSASQRKGSSSNGKKIYLDDIGLYIAGDGTQTSKDLLKTADGYVYAIPLFRVKRRNNAGYRVDNLNGARDYYSKSPTVTATSTNNVLTANFSSVSDVKVGDKVGAYNSSGVLKYAGTVTDVSGNNVTITFSDPTISTSLTTSETIKLISDRPDGKYDNIIDKDDIIDLRHKVSLTGFNYQQLLEENFDKLLRGELQTKDKPVMKKERFNLVPAPLGLKQELVPVKVIENDGVERELVNLIGCLGNFEILPSTGVGGYSGYANGTASLDTTKYKYGKSSLKGVGNGTSTEHGVGFDIPVNNQKYYLFIAEVVIPSGQKAYAKILPSGQWTGTIKSASQVNSNGGVDFQPVYIKVAPSDIGSNTSLRFVVLSNDSTKTGTYYFDGLRIYEIDQATYDKIDVDPAFTGEELVKKFPYVDSYPNFVENLLPLPFEISRYNETGSGIDNTVVNCKLAVTSHNNAYIGKGIVVDVIPNQPYTFSCLVEQSTEGKNGALYIGYSSSGKEIYAGDNVPSGNRIITFTPTQNKIYIKFGVNSQTAVSSPVYFSNIMLTVGSTIHPFVPKGRWFLPHDYANGATPTNFTRINDHRGVVSDAQTSVTRTDIVEPLKTPQSHIVVTQATEGQWTNGDTIKIKSVEGVISGVIDTDTALARITADGTSVTVVSVDDVSKLAVNDTIQILYSDLTPYTTRTITAVDTTNKTVTLNSSINAVNGMWIVETTASTSSPVAQYIVVDNKTAQAGSSNTITLASDANGTDDYYNNMYIQIIDGKGVGQRKKIIDYVGSTKVATVESNWSTTPDSTSKYRIDADVSGTWSGLGTKEATFTLSATPINTTSNIKIDYSISYPAGHGITEVPSEVYEARVNGERLVKASDNILRVKANFDGKVSGNTDLVPHIAKHGYATSLLSPSSGSWMTESQTNYDRIRALDSQTYAPATLTNGQYAQVLFSFDLIRLMEDKFGHGFFSDCVTTADKVNKLKSVITKITYSWWGYGQSPTGYKATTAIYRVTTASWADFAKSHTNGTVTKLTDYVQSNVPYVIDSNGFIHILAYADPSDGVTASTIYTDYVELEVELNVAETGYDVLVPENPFPKLNENLLTANQAFPVDLADFSAYNSATISIDDVGVVKVVTNGVGNQEGIRILNSTGKNGTYYTASVYVKGNAGATLKLHLSDGSQFKETTFTTNGTWQKVTLTHKTTSTSLIFYVLTNGTQATTFYVKQAKIVEGVTVTSWNPGRKKKTVFNFLGKVAGSTIENPHRAGARTTSTILANPVTDFESGVVHLGQSSYDSIGKQDGTLLTTSTSTTGNIAQQVYEFDLSHLGLSLSELKKALRKLTVTWVGYGKGDNAGVATYGVIGKIWQDEIKTWSGIYVFSGTGSIPETKTITAGNLSDVFKYVTKDQKVYVLVNTTYPAGTASASELYTDYMKLEVELADYVDYVKSNVIKVRKETKEVKLVYPAKSYRSGILDAVELWYKYVPYQGVGKITSGVKSVHMWDKIYVTTYGTGKYKSAPTGSVGSYLSTLPLSDPKDVYNITTDIVGFSGEGAIGVVIPVAHGGYGFLPFAFSPQFEGEFEAYIFSNEFTKINPKNGKVVLAAVCIVNVNNELRLRVATMATNDSTRKISSLPQTNGACDDFPITGRPLVKGV
jgi:hypothetical protein